MRTKLTNIFNNIAEKYDSEREHLIPCFDDFYGIMRELIDIDKETPNILDIGAGTGLLTKVIYEKYPSAEYTLIDISDKMLKIAKERFKGKNNIRYLNRDYASYEFQEKYDVVVSSLSIHHLKDNEKRKLYKKIYESLSNKGIFVNGDQFLATSEINEKIYQKQWKEKIENTDLCADSKTGAFERMKLDKPATVENNLNWLKDVGFADVDIFYKYYNFGVILAMKI